MSLIVDVNPVPWKILELVRARILKNRAKKKKVDQGFSASAIRREIKAQEGLLAKRRMEEPSFVTPRSRGYGIGYIVNYDTPYGNNKFRIYAPNGTAYAEIDETAAGFIPNANPLGSYVGVVFEQGALGPGENVVEVGGVFYYPASNSVYSIHSTNWTFLPAGNGSAVFIFSTYYAYVDFYLANILVNPDEPDGEFTGIALGSYVDGLKLVQKAFFVSSNAVKEISVGSGFKSFTEDSLLPIVWTNVRLEFQLDSLKQSIGMVRIPNVFAPAPSPGFKPFSTGSRGFSLDPYDRSLDYYSTVRFGDLDSGGIAPLLGFGPGIYSYLANPAAANAAVNAAGDGPWAKQTAAEQFIGTDLLPSGSLADSSINPKKALLYTGTYPPANRPFGTMSQFSDGAFNRAPTLLRYNLTPTDGVEDPLWSNQTEELEDSVLYREPFGGFVQPGPESPLVPNTYTTPILFWDWDNPDYCERQLLDLGFNDADLNL
jgi:hypothetical protein